MTAASQFHLLSVRIFSTFLPHYVLLLILADALFWVNSRHRSNWRWEKKCFNYQRRFSSFFFSSLVDDFLNTTWSVDFFQGAIVMGLGYYTSEEVVYDKTSGQLVTYNTWKYKPPTTKDIPIDFRVEIQPNSINPFGVLRSKCMYLFTFCYRALIEYSRLETGHTKEK